MGKDEELWLPFSFRTDDLPSVLVKSVLDDSRLSLREKRAGERVNKPEEVKGDTRKLDCDKVSSCGGGEEVPVLS